MNQRQNEIKRILEKNRLDKKTMQNYWAAYMNMARHNLFLTLKFITNSMGCLPVQSFAEANEENIAKMAILQEPLSPEDGERARLLLLKHFPFLRIPPRTIRRDGTKEWIDPNEGIRNLDDLRRDLRNIAFTLNYYRNKYSHSRAIGLVENSSELYCGLFLAKVLTLSHRQIKERYKANKNAMQNGMIDETSFEFITEGVVAKDRMTGKMSPAKDYYLRTINEDNKLTDFGKLLLTSLLLEKKYGTELLSQCHFLDAFTNESKAPRLSERRLILEVITAMRIRLPEKKLHMEKQDIQVALDILNELKKCPAEVFDLLGDEDRSLFNVMSDTGDPVLLKRHSDRFAQLALSYLDSSKAFNSIRFQVNAGKFRYLFRDKKHCIDGQTRPRVLEEPLNGYRRLMEFEKERLDKQSGESNNLCPEFRILTEEESPRNDASILPYITDSGVRYLFDGDNIGISFGDFTPTVSIAENGRYKVTGKVADCSISKYELPALLFYQILSTEHRKKSPERIIKDTVLNYRKLFRDINDGSFKPLPGESKSALNKKLIDKYNVSLSDIPEKLAEYLTNSNQQASNGNFVEWKKRQLATLITDSEYRIQRLKETIKKARSADNKIGKKGYVYLKPGSYAAFIASDIVFFQECEASKKMTGLNFNILQSSLATFQEQSSTSFGEILMMFKKAGLITENNGIGNHPFLYKVVGKQPSDIIKFYSEYLIERKVYLEGAIPDDAAFLHKERKRWNQRDEDYYRDLAGRYLERPVQLPRQLFEQPIREILTSGVLGKHGDSLKEVIQEASDGGRCNTAFMILMYFYEYLNDEPQFFYGLSDGNLEHSFNYRFFTLIRKYTGKTKNILQDLQSGREKISAGFLDSIKAGIKWASQNPEIKRSASKRRSDISLSESELKVALKEAYKQMMQNERLLRRYAVQDAVLFLAARKTISSVSAGEFYLCDIKPQGHSILEQLVTVETEHDGAIISQENVKIKDYGKIYKLLHDRRIDDLLVRHKGDVVKMEDLNDELDSYDHNRIGVFGSIMDYERKISSGKSDKELMNDRGRIDFSAIQKHDTQNSDEDKKKIRLIRNAFSHNQYPQDKHIPIYYGEEIPGAAKEITTTISTIEKKTK